jgi:hypothetical protein
MSSQIIENTNVHTFEIKSNNSLYCIEITKTKNDKEEAIAFKSFDKNYVSNISYKNSFNLEALLKFSSIFKFCDTIDDALNIILQTFKTKEIKITKDENNIYLCIDFKLSDNNLDEIKIPLEKEKVQESDIIENICKNLSELKEKNRKLEEEIKQLKIENKNLVEQLNKSEPCTLLDIMCKKFAKSKYILAKDLSSHLNEFGLKDAFKSEIEHKFEEKATLIYDVKKDGDTLVAFMSKVFGKKNIASFHALHGNEKYLSVQLAYLNGKFEFINNFFNFDKTDLFTYGNYQVYEGEFCFTSFKAQNSRLFVKIEFDCIFVIFYEGENVNFIIKIRDNFINNPILYVDEGSDKISEFFETHTEQQVGELFNISRTMEVNLTELLVYQIGNE